MSTVKLFTQHLLERGVVSRDALLEALDYQKARNIPLWALAMEQKLVSPEQAKIIRMDQLQTDKTFTQVAVDKQILTVEQADELKRTQTRDWIDIGDALLKQGALNQEKLEQERKVYRQEQNFKDPKLADLVGTVTNREVMDAFLDASFKIFLKMTGLIPRMSSVSGRAAADVRLDYTFIQKVRGDRNFYYGLALPKAMVLLIAEKFLMMPQTEVGEETLDAVCEFVNIVVGNGCVRLSMKEYVVEPEPARLFEKGDPTPFGYESATIGMTSEKGDFEIGFGFF